MNRLIIIGFLPFLVTIFFAVPAFFASMKNRVNPWKEDSPSIIQITKVKTQFFNNGCPVNNDQEWIAGKAISCRVSPDGKFIGKFVYNGLAFPERYYELLVMKTLNDVSEQKVFSGDFRTLGWVWTENNKIKIQYNCGTGCLASKIIDTNETNPSTAYKTGEINEKNGWKIDFF